MAFSHPMISEKNRNPQTEDRIEIIDRSDSLAMKCKFFHIYPAPVSCENLC